MAKRPNIYKSPYKSEATGVYYGECYDTTLINGPHTIARYKIVNAKGAMRYNGMVPWQIREGNGKWLAKLDYIWPKIAAGTYADSLIPRWFAAETLDGIQAMLTKMDNDLNR